MKRAILFTLLIAVALVLAGCGGVGSNGIDKGKLESQISADTHLKLLPDGDYTVTTSCVEDKDSYHFSCLVTATDKVDPGITARNTFTAVCDKSNGGTCIWQER